MDSSDRILKAVRELGSASGARIASLLGISRQAAHRHLGRLLDQGKLERDGRTRGVLYRLPAGRPTSAKRSTASYRRTFKIHGLQEDVVFTEVSLRLNLRRTLSNAALASMTDGITEDLGLLFGQSRGI